MKGNQGLDVLAGLCGASKDCPIKTEGTAAAANTTDSAASSSAASGPAILPKADPQPTALQPNLAQQPWQQAMAAGAAFGGNPAMALIQAAALQAAVPAGAADPASVNAMQQLAYLQYMQVAQAQAAALQAQMTSNGGNGATKSQQAPSQIPLTFVGQAPQIIPQPDTSNSSANQQQNAQQQPNLQSNSASASSGNSMQPPLPSQVPSSQTTISTSGIMLPPRSPAPAKMGMLKPNQPPTTETAASPQAGPSFEDKKQLKRAANRRSAQLSRKRKKLFIEELKEENDELRRREQILKSIPDLIVVFDSSGKLHFVSHSVSRFLDFSPKELESSSFWDRLCDESVRLLKAAFMDALAARKDGMDTAPLGSGVWELRLVDKDGSHKVVTLNGVVHFAGESPECVCTIRPREEDPAPSPQDEPAVALPTHRNVSVSSGCNSSSSASSSFIRHPIKPQQSVISNCSDDGQVAPIKARRSMHQISDSGGCSDDSCSDEQLQ